MNVVFWEVVLRYWNWTYIELSVRGELRPCCWGWRACHTDKSALVPSGWAVMHALIARDVRAAIFSWGFLGDNSSQRNSSLFPEVLFFTQCPWTTAFPGWWCRLQSKAPWISAPSAARKSRGLNEIWGRKEERKKVDCIDCFPSSLQDRWILLLGAPHVVHKVVSPLVRKACKVFLFSLGSEWPCCLLGVWAEFVQLFTRLRRKWLKLSVQPQ